LDIPDGTQMARPALSEEERFSRRTALLDAARHLYRERGTLPTVANIAKSAGVAKGAVYLWFRSKDEIFVAILEDAFLELIARLVPIIESIDPRPEFTPDSFASQYAKLLGESPDVVRLSSVLTSMFRENLPTESFSRLDRNVGASLSKAGTLLEQRLGCPMRSKGADLLLHTWTLTIGLRIMMGIPDEMEKVLDDPTPATFRRGFSTELKTSVAQLWRGAMIRQQATSLKVVRES
jgi:AcrR family transcriptional regulator